MNDHIKKMMECDGLKYHKIFYLFFFASVLLFTFVTTSNAASINKIDGIVSNGATITIHGADFGNEAPNVIVFDDFESGIPGDPINTGAGSATYGQWDNAMNSASYGTSVAVSGLQSFASSYQDSYLNYIQANLPVGNRNTFISWWQFLPADDNWPGEGNIDGINWKIIWIMGVNTVTDDIFFPVKLATSMLIGGNESDPDYNNYITVPIGKGEWIRQWAWFKGSTTSTSADGEVKFWYLDKGVGVIQEVNDIGVNNLKETGSWTQIRPNGYGRETSNCEPSFDDIYIAAGPNAQARLEIGNASSYNNSTKLTVLTPTAWTDNQISATVNVGSFGTGESAYLFVFDSSGSVSAGYPITIGGNSGGDQYPDVAITSPTTEPTYTLSTFAAEEQIIISGTADDDDAVVGVTWSNSKESGSATNTSGNWATWKLPPVTVQKGETVTTTVTVEDTSGQKSSDQIAIISSIAWSATEQLDDPNWKDSVVRYCVRLLVEGSSVTESANEVVLGFQGRTESDYTIRKVSIAERDIAASVGDVVDSTWKKVTFDSTAWTSNITVPANSEKLSDPVQFNLEAGKDYYVTFKIDSPSVYLNPPIGYEELYFQADDHTDDIDWSANGHLKGQDFHGFSKIYPHSRALSGSSPPSNPAIHLLLLKGGQ
ncbi:MAG: hypothetical protein WGN25_01470 [Candidatus Electrothrix sp. GW3-4]|uniref:hypothetical protein n=1 Tax=Candidatus Electrothrix sp. GW3-4 TaxID=3126740 RepID=UPI0030CD8513